MNQNVISNYTELLCLNLLWTRQIEHKSFPLICKPQYIAHVNTQIKQEVNYAEVVLTIKESILDHLPLLSPDVDVPYMVLVTTKGAIVPKQDYYLIVQYVKGYSTIPHNISHETSPFSVEKSDIFKPFSTLPPLARAFTEHANQRGLYHTPIEERYEYIVRSVISHPNYELPSHLTFYGSNPQCGYDCTYFDMSKWV